jgi:hypothetical protein
MRSRSVGRSLSSGKFSLSGRVLEVERFLFILSENCRFGVGQVLALDSWLVRKKFGLAQEVLY